MSFSLVTQSEKLRILNSAKAEFEAELWKSLAKLGHNPDTYNISIWTYTTNPDDPENGVKCNISLVISRLATIEQKIAELS